MPSMPHITHLTTVHQPFDTRIFQKECRSLVQMGDRISLVARHTKPETMDDVKIIPLHRYTNRLVRMLFGPLNAFRLARQTDADIYHFHDSELLFVGILLDNPDWYQQAKKNTQKKPPQFLTGGKKAKNY